MKLESSVYNPDFSKVKIIYNKADSCPHKYVYNKEIEKQFLLRLIYSWPKEQIQFFLWKYFQRMWCAFKEKREQK